ncbi:MAG: hypothetical protein H0A75_05495 [Candidatus Methanofishera endochildressiae]|uniref:Uncharacterized protein n=1 Tax=Candidatus Methanofishera endochildressiae TaxID=2738884 RepID=A0A7Z0MP37_9GAMM|nr:hypothetical protein [Candidatus Methanofishera endochildressiae]
MLTTVLPPVIFPDAHWKTALSVQPRSSSMLKLLASICAGFKGMDIGTAAGR